MVTIRTIRGGFELHTSMRVSRPLEQVFAFFSDPHNLERITPPFLHFRILTPESTLEMREGLLIDYALRIRGLPVRWRSEISRWDPPHLFVDTQVRGPYRKWIHEHRFTSVGDSTLVEDRVEYSVLGGKFVHRFFVQRDLEKIFSYRVRVLDRLLSPDSHPVASVS